ncbi:sterol desaturase family protein [Blastomonas marina]|uniref:sterol desaturase family protein n=1 Tax=Blastomonas marina TaxID=1867408 RepID=UPI002AC92FA8|nr:sterol desaturase family protein [Blastomonas marina]WPZ03012.1 sterol desaturase family protein [Blastomonas marina]
MSRTRPLLIAGAALAIGGLLWAERRRPLRERTLPQWPRLATNLLLGASCALVIRAVETPLVGRIAATNEAKTRGIMHLLPRRLRFAGGLLAMDYAYYWWHVATHKVPFLWRFHRVHHLDRDLDSSTAIRFHGLDMLVSLPFRLVQTRLIGVDPATHRAWQDFFFASVLFHHSNLRLPHGWDRALSHLLTTPKMHGIHHSAVLSEQDSNWTSGFSLWDRLHGTFRDDVPQGAITIGLDDARSLDDLDPVDLVRAPFRPLPQR